MNHSKYKPIIGANIFSYYGSYLCIFEDMQDHLLYLSITRSPEKRIQRKNLIRLIPELDNKSLSYTYSITPGALILKTTVGTIEFSFGDKNTLRIRGRKIALHLSVSVIPFENASPSEDGGLEIAYTMLGKMLIRPICGAMWHNAKWIPKSASPDSLEIVLLPSQETGVFETVVHEYYSNAVKPDSYVPFDDCVQRSEELFANYLASFPFSPALCFDKHRLAVWNIFTHVLAPFMNIKRNALFESRTQVVKAIGWQQALMALITEDTNFMNGLFDLQIANGQLPIYFADFGKSYTWSHIPLLAFCLTDECATDTLLGLVAYLKWWITQRDFSGTGIPEIIFAEENCISGPCETREAYPLVSPVLITSLILLIDYISTHPEKTKIEQSSFFETDAKKRLLSCLETLWTDNGYANKTAKGELTAPDPVMSLIPIALNSYLPEHLLEKLLNLCAGVSVSSSAPLSAILLIRSLQISGNFDLSIKLGREYISSVSIESLSKDNALMSIAYLYAEKIASKY